MTLDKKITVNSICNSDLENIVGGGKANNIFNGALGGAAAGAKACIKLGPKAGLICGAGGAVVGGAWEAWLN
ncbi:Blp family class II bacteriocin [Marinilactibacillus kalidii]|uniref:Blp family class II bacteriocin n=1 Tax=Marinilactibacillus kalidii TaxID=2820274 RepID=UPI001ABE4BA1|nr:Blp family class II bacteriocin [Marinilactibacillus kalidii]